MVAPTYATHERGSKVPLTCVHLPEGSSYRMTLTQIVAPQFSTSRQPTTIKKF